MTTDWPAFLTARLDDEERVYDAAEGVWSARDLRIRRADIAAKRAILADYQELARRNAIAPTADRIGTRLDQVTRDIIHLCRPFAGHDDYPGDTQ